MRSPSAQGSTDKEYTTADARREDDAMADSAKTAEAAKEQKPEAAPAKKRTLVTTFGVVGGIMLLEGIGLFVVFKYFGAEPQPTEGMTLEPTSKPWEKQAELPLAEIRALNTANGRTVYYRLKVGLVVHADNVTKVQPILEKKKLTIEDLIGRTIREADERELTEPGLDTLKRRLRMELGVVLGDEKLVENILIPECMPLPSGM